MTSRRHNTNQPNNQPTGRLRRSSVTLWRMPLLLLLTASGPSIAHTGQCVRMKSSTDKKTNRPLRHRLYLQYQFRVRFLIYGTERSASRVLDHFSVMCLEHAHRHVALPSTFSVNISVLCHLGFWVAEYCVSGHAWLFSFAICRHLYFPKLSQIYCYFTCRMKLA